MTVRTTRRILYSLAALCAAGVAAVFSWAIGVPDEPVDRPLRLAAVPSSRTEIERPIVTSDQLASVWARTLQGRPRTPEPEARPVPRVAPPPVDPKVELLATVIDSDQAVAIVADARGRTDLKPVGKTLDLVPAGLLVRDIQADSVTLSLRGRSIRLRLKNQADTGLLEPPGMRDQ